jgi:anti-anti-sigma regulatory factor
VEPIAGTELELPAELDVGSVSGFLPRLEQALRGPAITVDGSKLQHLDTAGVQLLCALVRAAEQRGVALAWRVVSPMLVSYAKLLGVGHVLRFDGVRREGLEWFEG